MDQTNRRRSRTPSPADFQPGHVKTAGRSKGTPNKTTRVLKEAILQAAELEGSDTRGKDRLVGYLRRIAREDMRAFASLLGRVLPLQIENTAEVAIEVRYRSLDEVRRELEHRGVSLDTVARLVDGNVLDADVIDGDVVDLEPLADGAA